MHVRDKDLTSALVSDASHQTLNWVTFCDPATQWPSSMSASHWSLASIHAANAHVNATPLRTFFYAGDEKYECKLFSWWKQCWHCWRRLKVSICYTCMIEDDALKRQWQKTTVFTIKVGFYSIIKSLILRFSTPFVRAASSYTVVARTHDVLSAQTCGVSAKSLSYVLITDFTPYFYLCN